MRSFGESRPQELRDKGLVRFSIFLLMCRPDLLIKKFISISNFNTSRVQLSVSVFKLKKLEKRPL